MSHWNANGLEERIPAGRIVRKKKRSITETNEIPIYSSAEKIELMDLREKMSISKSSLDGAYGKHYLERYIYLSIRPLLNDIAEFSNFPFYVVSVSDPYKRNYLSCSLDISFYSTEQDMKFNNLRHTLHSELRELFSNCSSIVICNIKGSLISNDIYTGEIHIKGADKFAIGFMKLLEEICDIVQYSTILYTASERETNSHILTHLKNNWISIKKFINKRTNNSIIYYTKDL